MRCVFRLILDSRENRNKSVLYEVYYKNQINVNFMFNVCTKYAYFYIVENVCRIVVMVTIRGRHHNRVPTG